MTQFRVVGWGEVKAALDAGAPASCVDRVQFWEIWVHEPALCHDMLKSEFFELDPGVSRYFSKDAAIDFETNYKPKLFRDGSPAQGSNEKVTGENNG